MHEVAVSKNMALYKVYTRFILGICSLLVYLTTEGTGKVILLDAPHGTVLVCPGEKLLFKCIINSTPLIWSVTVPPGVETGVQNMQSKRVTSTTAMILPITLMDIDFNVSRLSANGTLPIISTLAVPNTMIGLNGTKVECSARSSLSNISVVATIHVINSGPDVYPHSNLDISSTETFMANSITVLLEWKEEAGVTYTANVFPATQAPLISVENATLQLNLNYNTVYNVNITATLCGLNSVTTVLNLSYVNCVDTFHEVLMHSSNSDTFLEGANVTFTCPPGQVLIGHNTSTCMGNGEWEPDPRNVECKVKCDVPSVKNGITLIFNSTLEGSQLVFWCDKSPNDTMVASCLRDGRWSEELDGYSCSNEGFVDTNNILNNPQTMIILPLAIVGGVALLLIGTVITVIAIIAVIKARGARTRKKWQLDTATSIQDYHTTSHSSQYNQSRALPPSEYSLIHYSATEELIPDSKGRNNLVYADIGPGSFETKNCMSTIDIQSQRVEYAQLNHSAQNKTPKLELKNQSNPVGPDTLINLDSLLIQLRSEITPKWYEFGEAMGIEKKVIEKYKQYSPEQGIVEILDNWLRNHAGQPTWREIAEALRKIGLQKLAFDIERVYDTGKLPIEVNMSEIPKCMLSDSAKDSEIPPPIPPRLLD